MLRELEIEAGRVVIADFEAGVGTMSRTDAKLIDCAIVVIEPYMKAIETGRRLIEMIRSNEGNRILVVANKIRDGDDLELIQSKLEGLDIDVAVPEDPEVAEADLAGESPVDRNPDSPAVKAIRELAAKVSPVEAVA